MAGERIGDGGTSVPLVMTGVKDEVSVDEVSVCALQALPDELLRKCIVCLSKPEQQLLRETNKFFHGLVNQGITRFTPQEHTAIDKLTERFPGLCALLITGSLLSPEKMISLAKHWASLTQGLEVEIQKQATNAAPPPKTVANPVTTLSLFVENPHAKLLEALDSAPRLTKTLRKQTPASGAALFQLFESLPENPAGHSPITKNPITKLNLSGLRATATDDEHDELMMAFTRACKAQHFSQLRVLDISDIKFDLKEEEEDVAKEQGRQSASITMEMQPEAEFFTAPAHVIPTMTGEVLLKQFFDHAENSAGASCKELRELRATHIYINGDELQRIAAAIKSNCLTNLEILDLSQVLNLHYSTEAAEGYNQFILELVSNLPPGLTELHLPPAPVSTLAQGPVVVNHDNSLNELIEAFRNGQFKTLKILNISRPAKESFHPFRTEILTHLDKSQNLQEFHHAGNCLGVVQFNNFCDHLENTLRDLRLLDLSRPFDAGLLGQPYPSLIRLVDALVGNDVVNTPSKIESLKLTQWDCTAEEIQRLHSAITESHLPNLKHVSLPYLDTLLPEQQDELFSMLKARKIDFHVHEEPHFDIID